MKHLGLIYNKYKMLFLQLFEVHFTKMFLNFYRIQINVNKIKKFQKSIIFNCFYQTFT